MDISRSVGICLVRTKMEKRELAKLLGKSKQTVSALCSAKTCGGKMLEDLSAVFDMKVSELVALGEDHTERRGLVKSVN
jgi:hypothetical protein